MIDRVRLAWTSLRVADRPAPGALNIAELSPDIGRDLVLGLDSSGDEHLLLEFEPAQEVPHGVGSDSALDIVLRQWEIGGHTRRYLDVKCRSQAAREVFDHFIAAVWDRILAQPGSAVDAMFWVVEAWREFLTAHSRHISRATVQGLIGEMLVLNDCARHAPRQAADAWVGASGHRHDFRYGDSACEVKTTTAHTLSQVTINGVDQLLAPENGHLVLHLVRLEPVPEGSLTLAGVVDLALERCPAGPVYQALAAAGVGAADLPLTEEHRFELRERRSFRIEEDSPRIVPASFVQGRMPLGVTDMSYRLDLDYLAPSEIDASEFSTFLQQMIDSPGVQP